MAGIAAGACALVGALALVLYRRRSRSADVFTDEAMPPIPPPRDRRGVRRDRGRAPGVALDLDRLRGQDGLEPVVQYLTYIQSRRGSDRSHLLFVREGDFDAMAQIEGRPVPEFLEQLEQLGVVVSNN